MGIKKWFLHAIFFVMITSILFVFVVELAADTGGGFWWSHGEVWVGSGTPTGTHWRKYSCNWCHEAQKDPTQDKELFQTHNSKYFPKYRMNLSNSQEIEFGKAFIKWEKYRLHVLDRNHKLYITLPSGSYVVRAPNGGMGVIFPASAGGINSKELISIFQGVVK